MLKHQAKDGAKHTFAIAPATYAADTTPSGVDIRDYAVAQLELDIGVGGITFDATNKIEFEVTEADDDGTGVAGTYRDVAAADVLLNGAAITVGAGGIVKSLVAAHAAAARYVLDYFGGAAFVKVKANFSGTHGTGTPITATWRLAHGRLNPPL